MSTPIRYGSVFLLLLITISAVLAQGKPRKETIAIPMRDGFGLATDLFIPPYYTKEKEPNGIPVIFISTPYNKDIEKPIGLWRDCFLAHGYAVAVQDMRGFFASANKDNKPAPRHMDGYDSIEWLAKQPWCNGKVGMIGYSHPGAVQYEAAVTTPPHLACAIPAQAPGNYYTDSLYPPVLRKADMETILRGPITTQTRQLLNRRIRSREHSQLSQFNVPMLHSGGWYDFYKEGAVEMFNAVRQHGGPNARGTQKLLIGPWGHGVLQEEKPGTPLALPGGLTYPANAKFDWEKDVWLPWFDHWLKGKDTGVMRQPAVRYYLMGDVTDPKAPGNRWIETDAFPPKSNATTYYLHADRTLQTVAPTAAQASMTYQYDPHNPVPTVGRTHARLPVKGSHDQRETETRPDVLVFTTPELTAPLHIVGQIGVKLWASSDRKDTDFTVKLTDVYPDGRSMLFADGIVKGRYRNTYLKEELLTPKQIYEFDIDLGYIAIALAPGHRLRVAVSSSNFDRFDINPNTGEPYGDHTVSRALLTERLKADPRPGKPEYTASLIATNTIYFDKEHPSHVILPIIPVEELGEPAIVK